MWNPHIVNYIYSTLRDKLHFWMSRTISTSNWMPPKSTHPEVELFLNNVRKDILEPGNLRKPRDNLNKEERLALRNLKQ